MLNAQSIKLPGGLVAEASRYADVFSRSIPKQIEHWAKIGKIAEENPDLSYENITQILLAQAEADKGDVIEYKFG
jgi:hypothetical protein